MPRLFLKELKRLQKKRAADKERYIMATGPTPDSKKFRFEKYMPALQHPDRLYVHIFNGEKVRDIAHRWWTNGSVAGQKWPSEEALLRDICAYFQAEADDINVDGQQWSIGIPIPKF